MDYKSKEFWFNVPKGTEIEIQKRKGSKMKLYFDEVREFNDYGLNMVYICLQKDKNDIGNRAICVPVLLDDVVDGSIDGVSIHEKKIKRSEKEKDENKSEKDIERISETQSERQKKDEDLDEKKKENEEEVLNNKKGRKKKEYDFLIIEKNDKFYCPCGSAFSRRDTAVYVHRTRHMNKK